MTNKKLLIIDTDKLKIIIRKAMKTENSYESSDVLGEIKSQSTEYIDSKEQSCLQWVKASDRMPESKKRVNVKYQGNPNVIYYNTYAGNDCWCFDDHDSMRLFDEDWQHIEWLDENATQNKSIEEQSGQPILSDEVVVIKKSDWDRQYDIVKTIQTKWNFPNEQFIECEGALKIMNELKAQSLSKSTSK